MSDAMIEGFRLSPQQQHVWALQQLDSAQPYRTQGTIVIEGSLDIARLQASLLQVVQRYEILRTTFQYLQGMALPLQVVTELSELALPNYDLNEHSLTDLQSQLAQQAFDFAAGPLLHAWLGREHALKHYLLLSVPTLCADNLSLVNLTSELAAIYAAEPTTDEPMQYIDIAEWQHELLEAEETAAGRSYWQQQTWHDAITVRPAFVANQAAAQTFQPQQLPIPLTEQLIELLNQASQTLAVPASALALTAWRTLLWRLSDQTNGVVGVVCDGRKYAELETTLGLFAKAVPLASPLAADQQFDQLVKQVQQESVEAYTWQESFNWPAEVPSQLAFFPFGFEALTTPKPLVMANLSFQVVQQQATLNPYAAHLTWFNQPQGFAANLNFDAGLISPSTAVRLIEQYQTLLTAALSKLDTSLAQLPIVGTNERQQLLIAFNQTAEPFEAVRCFHELFSAQAAASPNHPAVVVDEQQLSYGELEARSNQLARELLARGVCPDQPVALALDRSLNLLVGILGILKAGAAYVPLDLVLPKERLSFMLADIQASIVVSETSLQAQLPEHAADYLWLDQAWPTIAEHSTEPVAASAVPSNLMYIIYTSGSTGQPKGVGVSHQSLYNYISSISQRLNLPPQASFASVSTFAADLGHTAIFPTLAHGGTLHLITAERASNASQLADYMQQHAVDCLKIVPSHLAALLAVAEPARVLPRQRLILGGEAVSWKLLQTLALLAPDCQVFNHYGPTETTVGVLTNPLSANLPSAQSAVPALGRPIANTQIYLLDVHGQPVPLGMAGELYVGGAALARGYWQRPAITAERFVPDGLSGQTGSRLYRTGDVARYLPDGKLEFLGRADDQVKIRGFRIELGEIEAVLRNHTAIEHAAVIVRGDPAGEKRLVAYLVAGQQRPLSLRELRNFLKQSLPDYMVPAAFVMLERLPLNANGKLDRQALPAPEQQQIKASTQIVAPRTPVETTLVEIWSQVLGGKSVGIHNNFFELGGDSILSIQIIARASQAGLKLTPKQLFDHPTIADLAQVVATTTAGQQAQQQLVTGPVPLTPIQHWFFEQALAEPQHYNQAVFFEVRFDLDPAILAQVLPELVRHHDALRLRFSPSEQGWEQVNSADVAVELLHINLADAPAEQQRQLMEQKATELQTSLDLTNGPLLRMALFELGADQPSRLLVIVHHLAIDTVSWQILFADLPLVYEQIRQQQPINLPAKTNSFKDWAERLQRYAGSAELEREVAYWLDPTRQQVRHLPVDYAAEAHANTVASTQDLSLHLSVEETKALLEVVPPVYNTQINDALLAALTQSISQWQGNSSVLVELEGHGREDILDDLDISRTVGWFTSRFPVLLQASKSANAGDSLRATKEQLRQIPQRGIGYGLLRYLRGDAQLSQQLANLPQPQLSFNYLGTVAHDVSQTGPLAWTSESSGPTRSPAALRRHYLDLTILVTDHMLQMNWTYSQAVHSAATIQRLAERFVSALQAIIQHCQQPNAGGYTPSDFPSANLNQKNLDSFIAKLRNSENSTHES